MVSPEAEKKAEHILETMPKGPNFGNARTVRNMLDATIQQLSIRVSQIPQDQVTKETYQLILPEDVRLSK